MQQSPAPRRQQPSHQPSLLSLLSLGYNLFYKAAQNGFLAATSFALFAVLGITIFDSFFGELMNKALIMPIAAWSAGFLPTALAPYSVFVPILIFGGPIILGFMHNWSQQLFFNPSAHQNIAPQLSWVDVAGILGMIIAPTATLMHNVSLGVGIFACFKGPMILAGISGFVYQAFKDGLQLYRQQQLATAKEKESASAQPKPVSSSNRLALPGPKPDQSQSNDEVDELLGGNSPAARARRRKVQHYAPAARLALEPSSPTSHLSSEDDSPSSSPKLSRK